MRPALLPWLAEVRATLTLALPLILSNLTMSLIQATDVLLMGRLGPDQLAASALGLNLVMPLTVFGMGLGLAASPMMASALGRRFNAVRDVRRTLRQSAWALATVVLPVWLLLWHTEGVLLAIGQEPGLARDAGRFMHGYQWSMLPFLMFQAMRNFVSVLERPGWIFVLSVCGVGLNALLSYALIFGRFGLPALGIFGGGLGSSIVWTLLAAGLAIVILSDRQFRRFHPFGRWWRADWPRYAAIWRLGLPIALTLLFEAAVFGAAIFLMGLIDADSVAAHAIALQLAALSFMVPLGLGQAATVRVGLGLGRGDRDAVTRAGWSALALGVAFMSVMGAVMWLIPDKLVGLFLDPVASPRVTALAIGFIGIAAIFQIVDGAQVVAAGMLRGLHDARVPMLIALFGYWVVGIGVGTGLAFAGGLEGLGIWIGLATGLAVVSVLLILRWARRDRIAPLTSGSAPGRSTAPPPH